MTETPESPTPEPVAARRGGKKRVALFLILAMACAYGWWQWNAISNPENPAPIAPTSTTETTTPPAENTDLAELRTTLAAHEARLKALEEKPAAPAETAQAPAPTDAVRVQDVLQLQKEIEQQRTQLQRLMAQAKSHGVPLRQLQLWVLLNETRAAIDEGRSILTQSAQLQAAWIGNGVAESEALRTLEANAETVVPTVELLQQDFASLRADIAAGILRKDVGFWYRIKAMLREQIRIRRTDEAPAEPDSDATDPLLALDAIQTALNTGDVRSALHTAQNLPVGKAALSSWIAEAQQRVAVEDALRSLRAGLLKHLLDESATTDSFAPFVTDTTINAAPDATNDTPPPSDAAPSGQQTE